MFCLLFGSPKSAAFKEFLSVALGKLFKIMTGSLGSSHQGFGGITDSLFRYVIALPFIKIIQRTFLMVYFQLPYQNLHIFWIRGFNGLNLAR